MKYFFGRKSLQSCIQLLESPVSIVTEDGQRGSYESSVPEKRRSPVCFFSCNRAVPDITLHGYGLVRSARVGSQRTFGVECRRHKLPSERRLVFALIRVVLNRSPLLR